MIAWMKEDQPHPLSTRMSRFRKDITFPPSTQPAANMVFQARCGVTEDWLCSPQRMAMSSSDSCVAVIGATGYKQRDPILHYWLTEDEGKQDKVEQNTVSPALIELA